jgi:hypothetical protein
MRSFFFYLFGEGSTFATFLEQIQPPSPEGLPLICSVQIPADSLLAEIIHDLGDGVPLMMPDVGGYVVLRTACIFGYNVGAKQGQQNVQLDDDGFTSAIHSSTSEIGKHFKFSLSFALGSDFEAFLQGTKAFEGNVWRKVIIIAFQTGFHFGFTGKI